MWLWSELPRMKGGTLYYPDYERENGRGPTALKPRKSGIFVAHRPPQLSFLFFGGAAKNGSRQDDIRIVVCKSKHISPPAAPPKKIRRRRKPLIHSRDNP